MMGGGKLEMEETSEVAEFKSFDITDEKTKAQKWKETLISNCVQTRC